MKANAIAPVDDNGLLWDRMQVDHPEIFDASRARLHYLAKLTRKASPVLNIGIGGGHLEQELLRQGVDVYSVDPSQSSVALLKERLSLGDRARVGRVESLPFEDNFFAAIVISEVMEHLSDDVLNAALPEMHRVLQPGGLLVGTVPAQERLFDQSIVCPSCRHQFHRWGHYQTFDCIRMQALLSQSFQVNKVFQRTFVCWSTLNWKGRANRRHEIGGLLSRRSRKQRKYRIQGHQARCRKTRQRQPPACSSDRRLITPETNILSHLTNYDSR